MFTVSTGRDMLLQMKFYPERRTRTQSVGVIVRHNMCAYPKYNFDLCRSLERGNSQVSCIKVSDSVDCALNIANGTADFGVFKPEEAVLVAKYGQSAQQLLHNISAIGEIRYKSRAEEKYSFRQVVVVRQNFSGTYKGKNYCHPGFQNTYTHTDRVLKHFERKVVDMQCKKSVNSAEQEITELSYFFKSACRPGPWAESSHLDKLLKSTFSNLCDMCGDQSSCQYSDDGIQGGNIERQVLKCLTERGGDIAYVTYKAVQDYFGLITNGTTQSADPGNYKFRCPDGTEQPLNTAEPCSWVRQPWSLVLSRRDGAETMQKDVIGWLNSGSSTGPDQWIIALKAMLLDNFKVAVNVSAPRALEEYIDRGCDDDIDGAGCREDVKWCTVGHAEFSKCKWLKAAAAAHGMVPKIRCVSSPNMWNCLNNIAAGKADVIGIDSEYGLIARNIFNMSTVVFEDSEHMANYHIIAVKKKDNTAINGFADLVDQKACFPEYRGLGWNAFVKTAKDLNVLKKRCPQRFFSAACAPGARDRNHAMPVEKTPATLTQLCQDDDDKDASDNQFFGDLGAIKCLEIADVAFVDYNNLLSGDTKQLDQNIDQNTLVVICRNGSLSNIPGLLVDEDCALSVGIRGEILTRANNTAVVTRDTSELFLKMNEWFGSILVSYTGVFKMFEQFEGQPNLLYQDGTVSLVQSADNNYPMVNSYNELLSAQFDCSSSNILTASFALLLIVIFLH
ncbi:hypothetical protein AAG570_013161 [Ranatra chinensis]|uniref:Transferrin-like domain-containing protein n=1 Tax=Ranatra chinensis TaxID=642074 RepID=A0ABD0Z278_9HEMI